MNTTRLSTPGCIPEDTSFVAPDGTALAGALQTGGEDHWPVIFEAGADPTQDGSFDYASDGPDSPEWDTVTLDGEAVFIDENDVPWLARHLIPADAERLSYPAVEFARRDYHAAMAARMAAETHAELEKAAPVRTAPIVGGPVNGLLQLAASLKADTALQAEQLMRAWLKARADGLCGVGIREDMVALPVQTMAEASVAARCDQVPGAPLAGSVTLNLGAACDEITVPARVAIGVSGGQVQWSLASEPGIVVTIVDFDVDGHTDHDLKLITDDEGTQDPANVWSEDPVVQPDYFNRLDVAPDVDGESETAPHYLEPGDDKWLVTGTAMTPGPDGQQAGFSYFLHAETALEAGAKAHAVIAADYPPGTKTNNVRLLPPSREKGGAA